VLGRQPGAGVLEEEAYTEPFEACEVLSNAAVLSELCRDSDLLGEMCLLCQNCEGDRVTLGYVAKVLRTVAMSEHQAQLLHVVFGRNMEILLSQTHSMSITDLLVTLLSLCTGYKPQKQSVIFQLADQACTGPTAEIRGHCRRAVEEILGNPESQQLTLGLCRSSIFAVILACANSCNGQKAIEGTRVLHAIVGNQAILGHEESRAALDFCLMQTLSILASLLSKAQQFEHNFELLSVQIALLTSLCRIPALLLAITSADILATATHLFRKYDSNSFLSVAYVKLASVLLSDSQLRLCYLTKVHIQEIILTMVLEEKIFSTQSPLKGFVTQISNMVVASDCSEYSSPKWNKYVEVILKRRNAVQQIACPVLKRPFLASGQDMEEDAMLQISGLPGVTKAPGFRQAEASTTPSLRTKCLKLLRKLQSMDEEVNRPLSVTPHAPVCLAYMNPVYSDAIRSYEAQRRLQICTEAFDRSRELA